MSEIKLSKIQEEVLDAALNPVGEWLYRLDIQGYAGTGKSTIISKLIEMRPDFFYLAPTNKAVEVLKSKGVTKAQTIFSFLYECKGTDNKYDQNYYDFLQQKLHNQGTLDGKLRVQQDMRKLVQENMKLKYRNQHEDGELRMKTVVVDESSMLDKKTYEALEKTGVRIITFGDAGQLPPVNGKFFLEDRQPHFLLKEVHRQKGESLVLDIATELRERQSTSFINVKRCPYRDVPFSVEMTMEELLRVMPNYDKTIVWRNKTVAQLNHKYRKEILGYREDTIYEGEKVMCLANNKNLKVFNGQTLTVLETKYFYNDQNPNQGPFQIFEVADEEGVKDTKIFSLQNLDINEPIDPDKRGEYEVYADYAYAMTGHKSQGSAWPKVLVVIEGSESWRWIYTAVTRASEEVLIVRL